MAAFVWNSGKTMLYRT